MTVYVVTSGEYSEYGIEKIFSNRPAAEEYKKWHNLVNDIEEYELNDVAFASPTEEKAIAIRVQGTVYPEAVVDLKYQIHPHVTSPSAVKKSGGIITHRCCGVPEGAFILYVYHIISEDKWEEESCKNVITKTLYDYVGKARDMLADGATFCMIEQALWNEKGI